MNIALPPAVLRLDEAAPAGGLDETVLLGMPQLSLTGLSEGWLLKELGHRHWMMLARMAGRPVPDFRDVDGAPVYAAFCALSVKDARFGELGENDRLAIGSGISRVSRTQCASRHALSLHGQAMGTVELVSAFVRRGSGGGNHAVARVALDGFPAPEIPDPQGLPALAAAMRAGRVAGHFGFDLSVSDGGSFEIDPCPSQDFNGAGFLYFSSFVAFLDRAEWHFDGRRAPRATTLARDVFFHGNADPGERVRVHWLAAQREGDTLAYHCRLERVSDGARIAEAFTRRALHA
jgi:probable biosynthetic protein (TIGR04099 family)